MEDKQKAIDEIIRSIIIHAKESWEGDYKIANKHFKSYTKAICKLIAEGDIDIISILIENEEPSVQSAGAYYLLPINKKYAEKKLKSLSRKNENGVGLSAKTVLNVWKGGNLKFPRLVDNAIVYFTQKELIARGILSDSGGIAAGRRASNIVECLHSLLLKVRPK